MLRPQTDSRLASSLSSLFLPSRDFAAPRHHLQTARWLPFTLTSPPIYNIRKASVPTPATLPLPLHSIFRARDRPKKMDRAIMDEGNGAFHAHLCVLIHGLWGNPGHLDFLKTSLRESFPEDQLHILLPKRNSGNFTYDGIEVGGERVTKEIEEELERLGAKGVKITKISVIGYSLGGLVARYAIGILYHKGFFDRIEPVNFTTFATPHLGVRTPLVGIHNHLWNVIGARTLSASGQQLFLIDSFRDTKRPLLSVLADPESVFIRALASFKHRSLYSNIINDRSAVFYTTCISSIDPFADLSGVSINYLPNTSNILVDMNNPVSPPQSEIESQQPVIASSLLTRLFGNYNTKALLLRARLGIFFTVFIPIGAFLYLTNAAIQSVRSAQRIRLHAEGKAGIIPHSYHIPLMVETAQRHAEDMFENMNNAHAQEFLEDSRDYDMDADESNSEIDNHEQEALLKTANKPSEIGHLDTKKKIGTMEFPTLALTASQFAMIDALDKVGIKKYPVHIHDATHSHAAIIVRMQRDSFREGKIVVKHWLRNFEL